MHLTHEILYTIIGFLSGVITGAIAFGAWLMGWLFPVPSSIASNDALAQEGKARSKVLDEFPFAWSDRYTFHTDEVGNVTYSKIPYAGDGE